MYDSDSGCVVVGACVVGGELGRVVVGDASGAVPDPSVSLNVVGTLTGTVGSGVGSAMTVDPVNTGDGGSVAAVDGATSWLVVDASMVVGGPRAVGPSVTWVRTLPTAAAATTTATSVAAIQAPEIPKKLLIPIVWGFPVRSELNE